MTSMLADNEAATGSNDVFPGRAYLLAVHRRVAQRERHGREAGGRSLHKWLQT
jgi:hypothetical protein